MPTFMLPGDESGDVGMSFGEGASRNFVLTMMAIQPTDELRNGIEVVRKNTNLPRNYQFKFHVPDIRQTQARRVYGPPADGFFYLGCHSG